MNRRDFFKSAASFAALLGINPAAIVKAEPVSYRYHSKEWWKQYFKENTQENELVKPKYNGETTEEFQNKWNEYYSLVKKRYSSDETYVQISGFPTDIQIDTLPDGRGSFLIFRMRFFTERKDNEIVGTPILLE